MAEYISPEEADEELESILDEAEIVAKGDFELEVFMSTDGKHTVHTKSKDRKSHQEAVNKAIEYYDYIKARFGTKQAQAVKEYKNGGKSEVDQETCPHTKFKYAQSKTEKNPGRWFKGCADCGKFLGWQD
jgi:hypothetical protein